MMLARALRLVPYGVAAAALGYNSNNKCWQSPNDKC
jgi:hypothetical protein